MNFFSIQEKWKKFDIFVYLAYFLFKKGWNFGLENLD